MKKISLQWKLTLLTTVLITILCGCLTFFLYKNGVYYFDTLQESITDQGTEPESVYIDIPDNEWDDFVSQFSMKVYNSKSDYRSRSLLITAIVALFGGAATYFISGRALKPLRKFSETVEKVQAQNLKDYTIEENKIAELDRLRISYNKMLIRLSESFETQRQFTGNAAHELRTPLALIQAQLDLYHTTEHPESTACKSSNPYPSPRLSIRPDFSLPGSFRRYDFPRFDTSQPDSCSSFSNASKSVGLCDNALSIATRSNSR